MSLTLPVLPRGLRWGAVGAVAGLICYWSLVTAPPESVPLALERATALTRGTDATTALSTDPDATTRSRLELPSTAARHFLAYAIFGVTLAYALVDRDASALRKAALVFVVATGYGALVEAAQLFHPDRVGSVLDVAVNAAGAAVSCGWYALERRAEFVPMLEYASLEARIDTPK